MTELTQIIWIEKFILIAVVGTMFVFCFWQEYDEKKRDNKKNEAKHTFDKKTSLLAN